MTSPTVASGMIPNEVMMCLSVTVFPGSPFLGSGVTANIAVVGFPHMADSCSMPPWDSRKPVFGSWALGPPISLNRFSGAFICQSHHILSTKPWWSMNNGSPADVMESPFCKSWSENRLTEKVRCAYHHGKRHMPTEMRTIVDRDPSLFIGRWR